MSPPTASVEAVVIEPSMCVSARGSGSAQPSLETAPIDELAGLLLLAATGCVASFEKFYQRTCRRLFGVILRINNDRAEAEEVLQEAYVKVWHQCKQFDPSKGQAIHWLMSVARHSAIDSLRRKQARPDRVLYVAKDAEDPFVNHPSPDATPMESLILQQQGAAVRWLLGALPTEQRQSLTLVFYGGLSHKELAQHMDRPLGTVKSWVRRALLSLRRSLDAAPCAGSGAGGSPQGTPTYRPSMALTEQFAAVRTRQTPPSLAAVDPHFQELSCPMQTQHQLKT